MWAGTEACPLPDGDGVEDVAGPKGTQTFNPPVGLDEEQIKRYVRDQLDQDKKLEARKLGA